MDDIYYAASNARSGCLYRFSCMTVDGEIKFTFHPAAPIVSAETNRDFADAFIELLETVAGVRDVPVSGDNLLDMIPENALVKAAAAIGSLAVLSHAGGYINFFQSILEMKENIADPADFWPAVNFWIFFAVGHPILQPILWISDVLHGSPGPMIGNLVPATFLAGNIVAIAAFATSKEVRDNRCCFFILLFLSLFCILYNACVNCFDDCEDSSTVCLVFFCVRF